MGSFNAFPDAITMYVKLDKISAIDLVNGSFCISARCHFQYTNEKLAKELKDGTIEFDEWE